MARPSILLVILAAGTLGCAGKPVAPPLVLGQYVHEAPRDEACAALIGQAVEHDARRGFALAGMLNTNTYPKPGESGVRGNPGIVLAPLGSHRAGEARRQMDGTLHTLFVDCETRQAYVARRGGVIDITYWFGPFAL